MLGRYLDLGTPIAPVPLNDRLLLSWVVPQGLGLQSIDSSNYSLLDLTRRFRSFGFGSSKFNPDPNGFESSDHRGGSGTGGMGFNTVFTGTTVALNLTASFTVACWFRQDAVSNGAASFSGLISKYQGSAAWDLRLSGQTPQFVCNASVSGGSATTLGQWHCVMASVDGSGLATLYLDGVSIGSGDPSLVSNVTDEVRMGIDYVPDTNYRILEGLIGGAWVWGRTLSTREALAWFKQCKEGYPDVLNWYSPFARLASPPQGAETATPNAATATAAAVSVSLRAEYTATANAAAADAQAVQPTPTFGTSTQTPNAATGAASAVSPSASQAYTATANAATATASAVRPAISYTDLLTPNAAEATAEAVQPSQSFGTLTVTPGATTANAQAVRPSASAVGSITATPNAATANATAARPSAYLIGSGGSNQLTRRGVR